MDAPDISWSGPAIGLMDLDAFFASVEQLDHPEWRGRPVIVGGDADARGVVSTASYEARAFGVHSAMPSSQARRLCPDAIWVRGNFARYREVSGQVMAIICDETPLVEQVSIDEAFFDVTPGTYSRESPVRICQRIQERVAALGVTCSIGLGPNKTVAKIASERQKPRGLTVVTQESVRSFLDPLPVRALSGIGQASERALSTLGIRTLGQLAEADEAELTRLVGTTAPSLITRARGEERSRVRAATEEREAKSVSAERTFPRDLTDEADLRAAVRQCAERVGTRLRRKGFLGREVTLKLKFDATHVRSASKRLLHPTDDEHVFGEAAVGLLSQLWHAPTPVRLVGVGMSAFHDTEDQLALFEDEGEPTSAAGARDLRALSEATDRLRERFGAASVSWGRDIRLKTPPSTR